MKTRNGFYVSLTAIAVIISTNFLSTQANAQETGLELEEIIVTAQRREQSLQEVPISIEAFSGLEIQQQGYRTLDDLAEFSPSVEIEVRMQDQNISIRGFGTVGSSLAYEQAAPIFVDGVVLGRTSLIKGALFDLERIEVLRGPQPVFFGQNAVAGAFSLITRKPTAEWEANVLAEVGNFGRMTLEGGIGGPLTDTLGVRVAGKYDDFDGFLTDVITGDTFPERRDTAGRLTLQWAPTEAFRATARLGTSYTDSGPEPVAVCLGENSDLSAVELEALGIDRDDGVPLDTDALVPGRTSFNQLLHQVPDCGDGKSPYTDKGLASRAWFVPPAPGPLGVSEIDSRGTGMVNSRDVALRMRQQEYGEDLTSYDDLEATDGYLDLRYTLANGIELSSLTAYFDYYRAYFRVNSYSPFFNAARIRDEDLQQTSQEFRITSAAGGKVEWMLGAYWQENDLDLISDSLTANTRRPRRWNYAWEDAEWNGLFAAATFNFMDDKASIDIGARYSKVDKTAFIEGWGARWVFAGPPVDPALGQTNDEACLAYDGCEPVVTTDGQPGYTVEWRERRIPPNWASPTEPIGLTALDPTIRNNHGPTLRSISDSEVDPQIVFRYRPNEDLSLYAKYATAFKAGAFDTAVASLPDDDDPDTPEDEAAGFSVRAEKAEIFEVGVKGEFWNGRARFDAALFSMDVDDLQLATIVTDILGTGATNVAVSTNAGLQRIRGLEFSIDAALTENLRGRLVGAILDGEMVDYVAECTPAEFLFADTGPCVSLTESEELTGIFPPFADDDEEEAAWALAGSIDRSGSPAPRTPDWKFAIKLDYAKPLNNRYTFFGDINFSASDGYITNVEEFDRVQMAGSHEDMNVSIGIGDADGRWRLSAWARNLFEVQEEYNREFDVAGDGIIIEDMASSMYTTYGLQFEYNYR
ncbi:MAG: TonB-dependent receptor [Gammaproteobacteria bacterium]|nr:TonB-dependent receptor [Gammaproteobacteria bacterium]